MNPRILASLTNARNVAAMIATATTYPDPAEGGCVGGPIPGYGCVKEGANAILTYLDAALALVETETQCTGHVMHNEYVARRDFEREEGQRFRSMHAERCASQGHELENCCSAAFRVYVRCKWCGHEE